MDKLTEHLEDWLPEFYEAKLVQGTREVQSVCRPSFKKCQKELNELHELHYMCIH